jgi:hypothetical protein
MQVTLEKYLRVNDKLSNIRNILEFKYGLKKRELKYRLNEIREVFILKFIMPQFLDYVRSVIIAKGLDPDKAPFIKQKSSEVSIHNVWDSNHEKRMSFNNYVPRWVSESFKDKTKHILYRNRNKPLPVVTEPVEILPEVNIGVSNEQFTDIGNLAMKNFRDSLKNLADKFPIVDATKEKINNQEVILEVAEKDIKKKPIKKTSKKKATKKPAVKKPAVVKPPEKDPKFKGPFRRV